MSLKEQWINALRSGDYKQGTGQLRNDNNEFCCLGVLADVECLTWYPNEEYTWGLIKQVGIQDPDYGYDMPSQSEIEHASIEYNGPNDALDTRKSYEFNDGAITKKSPADALIYLNDDAHATFEQIADWVEQNLNDDLTPVECM